PHGLIPRLQRRARARRRPLLANEPGGSMCGIAGSVALDGGVPPPSLDDLTAMVGAIRHRGPDEVGLYRDASAGLPSTRLSIVDLSTGQQPISDGDGRSWIVYNGELFNHVELRDELRGRGHQFHTQSDTEVALHAWQEWGAEAFRRFNGQYALAIWEADHE